MKNQSLRREVSRKRRWWWLVALAPVVAGLGMVWKYPTPVRQFATTVLNTVTAKHTAGDEAGHAETTGDAHEHDEAEHDREGAAQEHTGEAKQIHSAGAAHADDEDHDEDTHAAAVSDHKHDETAAIKLSKQAQGNIGLNLTQIKLRPFERTITVPGMVVERPGWSTIEVTAPMTGVVTRILPIQGEAVQPGQPLFDIRLTHEDLLQVQTEFLRTIEELDVIGREVERLEKASADGVIAGKTLLERKYEQQKQEAALRAQRQALLLHGLSVAQVDKIVADRALLQSLTICAPARDAPAAPGDPPRHLQVQALKVAQGRHVNAGDTLCTLVDHRELYVEGLAFEQDIQAVNRAAATGQNITAVFGSKSAGDEETVADLRILYLDDKVEQQSRAFHFYVTLPNRVARQDKASDGRRFVYWQFKPGQRTQVRIPIAQWSARIVLPVEAVAQEGAEFYVFEVNGDHFDRRSVHVEYRDQDWAVIANDGTLRVGAMVAASAAHQVQLALKNKNGGGVDPHAGHNH